MKKNNQWETIVDLLMQEFREEKYKKGEKMPSENKMAARYGVTRSEIRRAYDRLKELGYIYSLQGYGSFFSGKRDKIKLLMTDSQSFSQKMKSLGVTFETKNLGIQKVRDDSLLHDMLGVDRDETVYKLTRLRYLDGEPAAIHINYLAEDLFPQIRDDGPQIQSLHEYMRGCGYLHFRNENSQVIVSPPTKKERNLLDIKGYASSLVLTSKCIDETSKMVLGIERTVYRSDKFVFVL